MTSELKHPPKTQLTVGHREQSRKVLYETENGQKALVSGPDVLKPEITLANLHHLHNIRKL